MKFFLFFISPLFFPTRKGQMTFSLGEDGIGRQPNMTRQTDELREREREGSNTHNTAAATNQDRGGVRSLTLPHLASGAFFKVWPGGEGREARLILLPPPLINRAKWRVAFWNAIK